MHHDVANEKPAESLTLGDLVGIGVTCVFVTTTTFLLSLMGELGQARNVAIFAIFIITLLFALCLDDPNMWEEEETVPTLMTRLSEIRRKYPTSYGMPVSTRWFLGSWFVWLAYAHLFGDGDYSSLDHPFFVGIKTIPLVLSWILLSTSLLEMKFELMHFGMLFVVAALSVVPNTSVMSPQVSWFVNVIRVMCACCLYAGGNVFLFRRCCDNYHLDRNRVYLGLVLVFWVFFVPFVSLFGIVVNCILLVVFDKTDIRRIAGPGGAQHDQGMYDEEIVMATHDPYDMRASTPIEDEDYDDEMVPEPRSRMEKHDIIAFANMPESAWASLNVHPDDVALIQRERQRIQRSARPTPAPIRTPQPTPQPTPQTPQRHARSSLSYSRRPNR